MSEETDEERHNRMLVERVQAANDETRAARAEVEALKTGRKLDPNGSFARHYWNITDSPAFCATGFAARALYAHLRRMDNGKNNGNISATPSMLKHAGFGASATLTKALRELQAVGLIRKTRQGGATRGGRLCNLFRFTDMRSHANERLCLGAVRATHEWKRFKTKDEAKAAIDAATGKAPPSESERVRVQNLKHARNWGSKSERVRRPAKTATTAPRLAPGPIPASEAA